MAVKEKLKEPSSNDDSDEVDDPDEIPEISSDESDLEEFRTQDKVNKHSPAGSASKNNSMTKSKTIFFIEFVQKTSLKLILSREYQLVLNFCNSTRVRLL